MQALKSSRPALTLTGGLLLLTSLLLAQTTERPPRAVKATDALLKRQGQIQKAVRRTQPAVLGLVSERRGAGGSGVIISEDGLILTAAHVLQVVGEEFPVIFPDGSTARARRLGENATRDAAMAQLTGPGPWPFVEVRKKPVAEGEWVMAQGHPNGFQPDRTPPIRVGRIINARGNWFTRGFLMSDCTLAGGDSGGPLFDLEGKLVGIHSQVGLSLGENMHVPIPAFTDDWEQMKQGKRWGKLGNPIARKMPHPNPFGRSNPARKAKLGVVLDQEADLEGAVVQDVIPESPAAKAGLKQGDVIIRLNDTWIESPERLVESVQQQPDHATCTLQYRREGKKQQVEVTLAESVPLPQPGPLGGGDFPMDLSKFLEGLLQGAPLDDDDNIQLFDFRNVQPPKPRQRLGIRIDAEDDGKGALVQRVNPGSAAEAAGVQVGDRILRFGDEKIRAPEQLVDALNSFEGGKTTLRLTRDGEKINAKIELGPAAVPEPDAQALPPMIDQLLQGVMGDLERQLNQQNLFGELDPLGKALMKEMMRGFDRGLRNGGDFHFQFEKPFMDPNNLEGFLKLFDGVQRGLEQRKPFKRAPHPWQMPRQRTIRPEGDTAKHDDDVLEEFDPVVARARKSTVRFTTNGKPAALGIVVHPDGWVLTKKSEINFGSLRCELPGGRVVRAKVEDFIEKHDVALVKVQADNLTPAEWGASDVPLGSLVAANGLEKRPVSIGTIAVLERSLSEEEKGFLGVSLQTAKAGVGIRAVMPDGPAAGSGIRVGDVVTRVNRSAVSSVESMIREVSACKPGSEIQLTLRRNGNETTARVTLGSRAALKLDPRLDAMNITQRMGGKLSDVRNQFTRVLQTDLFLTPEECGGPLVGLDGKVIGLNIARAGRVKSYALPSELLQKIIRHVTEARLVPE